MDQESNRKEWKNFFNDIMGAYNNSSKAKDERMMGIAIEKEKFVENLDEMWANYIKGCPAQIVDYNKGVEQIKKAGYKVLRNSAGKHKIVLRSE